MNTFGFSKKLFLAFGATIFLLGLGLFVPEKAAAAPNNQGLGWAMPVVKTNRDSDNNPVNTCFGASNSHSFITVVLVNAATGAIVTGDIRMRNVNSTFNNSVSVNNGNSASIGCITPGTGSNAGVWVSVWDVPGFQSWSNQMTAPTGNTQNFNWCCGFQIDYAGTGSNGGYSLVYFIYLIPSGNPAIEATSPQPSGVTISTMGTTANVPITFRSVRGLPQAGGSTTVLDGVIWLSGPPNPACGGGSSCFINLCYTLCGNSLSIGGTLSTTLNNLPLGEYRYYVQLHENARRPCTTWLDGRNYCLDNDIPITAQTDFQTFTIANPNLPTADIKANGSNGPITISYNTAATISWTSTNATSCTVTPGGWTDLNNSGVSSGNLTNSRTYTLTCSNSFGSDEDTVRINVTVPANSGDLLTYIFNDKDSSGTQSLVSCLVDPVVCEPTVLLSEGSFIVRNGSESGSDLTLVGGLYHNYRDTFTQGNVTIFIDPDAGWTPTRYAYRRETDSTYTTGNYVAASGGFSRTGNIPIIEDQNTRLQLGVRQVSGQPDLIPTALSAGAGIVGSPMNFLANIRNAGSSSTSVGFTNRLRIDLNNDGGFDVTLADQSSSVIAAGVTEVPPRLWLWPSAQAPVAPATQHRFEVCADTSDTAANNNRVTESNVSGTGESNNCVSQTFTVTAYNSWLKTERGNIGSEGDINLENTPAGLTNADYLTLADVASVSALILQPAKNWLVEDYNPHPPSHNNYSSLLAAFGKDAITETISGTNEFPADGGIHLYPGSVNWRDGFSSGACGAGSQTSVVIFVNGDLNIQNNPDHPNPNPCPTVIVVRGAITVDPSVTQIGTNNNAGIVLISDGVFSSGSGNSALNTYGAVYSSLAGGPGPNFGRQVGSANPSEHFILDPRIFWAMVNNIGVSKTTYQEINP